MARAVLDTGANQVTLELEYAGFVDAATNGSIGASTSSVKLTLADVYVCTGSYTFYDSSNKCVVTGTLVADKTVTNSNLNLGRNDQAKITSLSPSPVALGFGGTTSTSVTVDMTGLGYPGDMKGTLYLTAPRRIYGKPSTPSVSISTSAITWGGNQTNAKADKYWQNADVDYQINDTWYAITTTAAPGDTSRSFSSSANNRYRGRVRAKNQDATGDYGYSAHYYTTPSAPSNFTATRAAGSTTTSTTPPRAIAAASRSRSPASCRSCAPTRITSSMSADGITCALAPSPISTRPWAGWCSGPASRTPPPTGPRTKRPSASVAVLSIITAFW